jgi:hypothetical protein
MSPLCVQVSITLDAKQSPLYFRQFPATNADAAEWPFGKTRPACLRSQRGRDARPHQRLRGPPHRDAIVIATGSEVGACWWMGCRWS